MKSPTTSTTPLTVLLEKEAALEQQSRLDKLLEALSSEQRTLLHQRFWLRHTLKQLSADRGGETAAEKSQHKAGENAVHKVIRKLRTEARRSLVI